MKNRKEFIVVDLELSCWEDKIYQKENAKIIEIGVAKIDFLKNKVVDKASYLIKSKTEISDYCTKVTSITQEMIDEKGMDLNRVSKLIRRRFSPKNIAWGGWGSDNIALLKEFENKVFPFSPSYWDLSLMYQYYTRSESKIKLLDALKEQGLTFEGKHHRADDDAYNTARLFLKFLEKKDI